MLAADTNCPAVTATPDSFRLPAAGKVVILTAASALAGVSLGSVKPKSLAVNVYTVSSGVVTVWLVPTGGSLIGLTVSTKVSKDSAAPSVVFTVMVTVPLLPDAGVK